MTFAIQKRLNSINQAIQVAAESVGKKPSDITLIAASKTQSPETLKEAFEAGITLFGENYVQEFLTKWEAVQSWDAKPSFVFIGHLQTNKVKYIIDKVIEIQTVDSRKLLEKINLEAQKKKIKVSVKIQVNVGEEASKGGVHPKALKEFFSTLPPLSNVTITGLMALPPYQKDPEASRNYFKKMKAWLDELNLSELSMGMSHDFTVAIEEGATHVRIGEGIFGPRP